jgi:predicted metal-dependent hydrolase
MGPSPAAVKTPMPTLPGSPPIAITLRRNARARRFSLRVAADGTRVTLTLPARAREAEAMAFARSQEGWLRATLARMPVATTVAPGRVIPVEGVALQVAHGTGRLRIEGTSLVVPGDPAQAGARVAAWLKVLARTRLAAAADRHAAALGRPYSRLALRDARSRWGSCSAQGALMFNWRLVMAPPAILDYVAAHEVAHLAEMNHSPAFWAVVTRLCPDWQARRAWLRANGGALQAWHFTA